MVKTQEQVLQKKQYTDSIIHSTKNNLNKSPLFIAGIVINALMLCLLLAANFTKGSWGNDFLEQNSLFFLGYILCAGYFTVLIINRLFVKEFRKRDDLGQLYILSLSAFSLSAYLLNMSMLVFSSFVSWANVAIVAAHLSMAFLIFKRYMPNWVKTIFAFVIGVTTVFIIYQTIYLVPIYHIGLLASPFLGISFHTFVPLLIAIAFITYYFKHIRKNRIQKLFYFSGLTIPLICLALFLFSYGKLNNKIHQAHATLITQPDNELPAWAVLSQQWSTSWVGKGLLGASIIYDDNLYNLRRLENTGSSFNEVIKHDPMVLIANLIFGQPDISRADRIKILESQYASRHNAERKLWRGDDLSTTKVLTNATVYPDYRMAYVEKIFTIKNSNKSTGRWNNNQQEALYSFYLPEGSVASSLSLWVNGIEEKSRLTTKKKADKAYTEIVGVERRDPALLHWQEGNRLTVTVFPCTPKEDRIFKLGITVPLKDNGDELVLNNFYFEGPDFEKAKETTVINVSTNDANYSFDKPCGFKKSEEKSYSRTARYNPDWALTFPKPTLNNAIFSFKDNSYQVEALTKNKVAFKADEIYLDLNSNWTRKEVKEIFAAAKGRPIYVFNNGKIKMDAYNDIIIKDIIANKRFSLFPIHEITNPEKTLVISKSEMASPNLKDLEKSDFRNSLEKYMNSGAKPFKLFHIGEEYSPYLATLKQFNAFDAFTGDVFDASKLIRYNTFYEYDLDDNEIALETANIKIKQSPDLATFGAGAPDHLMRLFNYNLILKKIGSEFFNADNYTTGELIDLANAAYVVSPISSMIVLETLKDYDRFDIKKNQNSLKNASAKSSGSVPEPHEWVLIILSLITMTYLFFKDKFRLAWNKS